MAYISGLEKKSSGGGGLGSLIGKVLGGAAGFMIGGPAGALAGSNIGGTVGGVAGSIAKPGENKSLGVNNDAQGATIAQPKQSGGGAIERLNSVLDIGSTVAGAVDGFKAPEAGSGLELPKTGATSLGVAPLNPAIGRRWQQYSKVGM